MAEEDKKIEALPEKAKKEEAKGTKKDVSKKATAEVKEGAKGPEAGEEKASVVKKKKIRRSVPVGKVYVHASFNNTIVSITDTNGNVLAWSSAGARGFKGARKGTPFAAQVAAEDAARKAAKSARQGGSNNGN